MNMMRKILFAWVLLLGSAQAYSAGNLVLNEDFESQDFPPAGWTVKGTELPADAEAISLRHLAAGVYIVTLTRDNSVVTARIVKY